MFLINTTRLPPSHFCLPFRPIKTDIGLPRSIYAYVVEGGALQHQLSINSNFMTLFLFHHFFHIRFYKFRIKGKDASQTATTSTPVNSLDSSRSYQDSLVFCVLSRSHHRFVAPEFQIWNLLLF